MEQNIEERIIQAAKETFLKKGFKDTNMADVAAEVGLTRPAMHYYFRTKERLFQAVFEGILSRFLPRLKDYISARMTLEEKVTHVVETYLDILQETPELPFFIISEINRDSTNLVSIASESNMTSIGSSVIEAIDREMEEGRIRKMPVMQIFLSFYGLLLIPFLTRPIGQQILGTDPVSPEFMAIWKANTISQMTCLLTP